MAVYPRVHGPLTVRTTRRGSGRVRAEANFPAREAEAHERVRDRVTRRAAERASPWVQIAGLKPRATYSPAPQATLHIRRLLRRVLEFRLWFERSYRFGSKR